MKGDADSDIINGLVVVDLKLGHVSVAKKELLDGKDNFAGKESTANPANW